MGGAICGVVWGGRGSSAARRRQAQGAQHQSDMAFSIFPIQRILNPVLYEPERSAPSFLRKGLRFPEAKLRMDSCSCFNGLFISC